MSEDRSGQVWITVCGNMVLIVNKYDKGKKIEQFIWFDNVDGDITCTEIRNQLDKPLFTINKLQFEEMLVSNKIVS